jgi:hypothetical protein
MTACHPRRPNTAAVLNGSCGHGLALLPAPRKARFASTPALAVGIRCQILTTSCRPNPVGFDPRQSTPIGSWTAR